MSTGDPNYDVPCDEACDAYKDALSPYRFPRVTVADSDDIKGIDAQSRKIAAEAAEVWWEITDDSTNLEAVAEETWDTIHASETLLHMLEANGVDIVAARDRVEAKNRTRGYYNGGDAS